MLAATANMFAQKGCVTLAPKSSAMTELVHVLHNLEFVCDPSEPLDERIRTDFVDVDPL